MNEDAKTVAERFEQFSKSGYDLQPEPYRIRNADGSPGPWKSKVLVFHHRYAETTVRSICGSRKYAERDHAAFGAILMGLNWLEENAA